MWCIISAIWRSITFCCLICFILLESQSSLGTKREGAVAAETKDEDAGVMGIPRGVEMKPVKGLDKVALW